MEQKAFSRAVSALPSLTAVLRRIFAVVEDSNSSVLDITRVLQMDPAITGKVFAWLIPPILVFLTLCLQYKMR